MQLTIKGLKTWQTNDGGGYQFNLYHEGKKTAFVHNGGYGGCLEVTFYDKDFEASIRAFVSTLPDWEAYGVTGKMDLDMYLCHLLEDYETQKILTRLRKKSTPFRLLTDDKAVIRSVGTTDINLAKAVLEADHPNNYILL